MTDVRPTKKTLKDLRKGDRLPANSRDAYVAAVAASDGADERTNPGDLLRAWSRAVIAAVRENALLKDAVAGFSDGGYPDRHASSTEVVGSPVFEVRDREGAAWRGALVIPGGDDCAWMVYADRHDRFHQSAARVLSAMKTAGTLGPGKLDLRIREWDRENQRDLVARTDVLEGVIDALRRAGEPGSGLVGVQLPAEGGVEGRVELRLDDVDAMEWDGEGAHETPESVMVSLVFPGDPGKQVQWLLQFVVPFLQPDTEMIEQLYGRVLRVQVIMTRARLMQLMALHRESLEVSCERHPPAPTVLHYTAKESLAAAYVQNAAVQSVCGQWWIPVGDGSTHGHLPICPDCQREEPFAQALKAFLRA